MILDKGNIKMSIKLKIVKIQDIEFTGDQIYALVDKDGFVIATHVCSSQFYAKFDLWINRPSLQSKYPDAEVELVTDPKERSKILASIKHPVSLNSFVQIEVE